MKYLLDTHILLWSLLEPTKIKQKIQTKVFNNSAEVYVSSASFWEISIKYNLGKLKLKVTPEEIYQVVKKSDAQILELGAELLSSFYKLPHTKHRDPFDRVIIWQAIQNKLTLVSTDKNLHEYKEYKLKLF